MGLINSINITPEAPAGATRVQELNRGKTFSKRLEEAANEVNNLQLESTEIAQKFANGEIEDIHEVMIAAEKASVGLELVLEVRSRLVDAYREISRMQI